ncbi:DNA-binding domain-containing protein [Viridibacterium curvum]|uniref:DNA-binding domain-containing protein n=1 Tax=Viridibacterium curvum TaxID=1101404 RepID=A0ABP9R2D4_9RHOO
MPSLIDVQRRFANVLRAGQGEADMLACLQGDAQRNASLLAVYRGNAVANAHKALQLAYPVICQIVGEDFFEGLARAYRDSHASRSGDLNEYGADFADFLAEFEHVADMPYLPAVAQLEWAVTEAERAADHVPLSMAELASFAPEQLGDLQLGLQAAACLVRADFPVASIWLQHQPAYDGALNIDLGVAECCIVHRIGWHAAVLPVVVAELAFWQTAQSGAPLATMLDAAFSLDEDFDVQTALSRGFTAELVTRLQLA